LTFTLLSQAFNTLHHFTNPPSKVVAAGMKKRMTTQNQHAKK